jgi:OOP family OmpA-OmpF porin
MKKKFVVFCGLLFAFICINFSTSSAAQDAPGSKDHPLLTRMPGFYIEGYDVKEFDSVKFLVGDRKSTPVEGKTYRYSYHNESGRPNPSTIQLQRNYVNAVKKAGGTVVFEAKGDSWWNTTLKTKSGDKEVWVAFEGNPNGYAYTLTIVEVEAMKQEVEANAEAMGNDINATGHVSIYGIYFDTGKAEVKPESDAAISEIAKLLKNNAALNVYVVGHTDNAGSFDSNMQLSKNRADAVVKELVSKHGIADTRLKANGVSSLSPVASNKTEEGKAKNRRVELVEL